jgi:phosphatidylglycerophosphate synthase
VSTASARRAATWQLLRASGKPTDGWLSRHVHRKISRVLSFVLLQLGLTANVATLLTLLVGIASAWLIAQTSHLTMILGALLFWFASIADGIDGEMARVTLTESPRGEQIDTAVDHLTHVLCYVGVLVGWWRQGIDAAGYTLAIAVSLGVAAMLLWAMRIVRRAKDLGQLFVDTKPIELGIVAAAESTRAPMLRAAAWVFALFRREAFSLSFLVIALVTSRRAVYPFTIAVGLAIVALTLIVHGRAIERAIQKS